MPLKFYLDTHIAKQVAVQLRNKGIDAVRCEEVDMAEASDEEHLRYATEHDRAMITKDDDFLRLHQEWEQLGQNHAGIFFCKERYKPAIGEIVAACLEYYTLIDEGAGAAEDIHNTVIYI